MFGLLPSWYVEIMWLEIWKEIGVPALLVTVGAWVVRSIFTAWLNKDVDAHKHRLERDSALAMEKLRAEMAAQAHEHEVRFTRLHNQRAEVIGKLYGLIHTFISAAEEHLIGVRVERERLEAFKKGHASLVNYFEENRIYFSEDLCESVDSFILRLRQAGFDKFIRQDDQPAGEAERKEMVDALTARWKTITDEVPAIRRKLENEFRDLLGVQKKKKQ